MSHPVWCPRCRVDTPHDSGGDLVRCTVCHNTRPDNVQVLTSPVEAMEYCVYCRQTLPVDHACEYGSAKPLPCPTPEGHPCGCCLSCLAAQAAHLRYGGPSDFDHP